MYYACLTEEEYKNINLSTRSNSNGDQLMITFKITNQCNLRCTYCYECCKNHDVMPFEIAQRFLDKLFEQDKVYWSNYFLKSIFEYKYVILDFFGGEVSLFPQLIEKIVQYFLQKAAKYCPQ